MQIDKEKCVGCKKCHPYCPMAAIFLTDWEQRKVSEVNQSDCVECGACRRSSVCPKEAIFTPELQWARSIRPSFSSPHGTPLPGLKGFPPPPDPKLNDLNNRISEGVTAVVVEAGRPGVGTSFLDVEKICVALAACGVTFDPGSSVTGLMVDPNRGKLQPDVLDQRVMHVMIHYTCTNDSLRESLQALKKVSRDVNTVFSVGFSTVLNDHGVGAAVAVAEAAGFAVKPHAKTNVGMQTPQKREVS